MKLSEIFGVIFVSYRQLADFEKCLIDATLGSKDLANLTPHQFDK
jgi:hypothetical protein